MGAEKGIWLLMVALVMALVVADFAAAGSVW